MRSLSNELAKLEGAQEPLPAPINETTPPVPTKSSEPESQQAAPPERKLNVVVHGLEENRSNTTRQDRLQMDGKSVISAFSKLEIPLIDESSIKDCYRLGKYNPEANRLRPVLVKFLRYTDAFSILNSKSKLSKPVFVKPDLTAEERVAESLLLKERRCLIEKGIARHPCIKIRNQSLFVLNKLHATIQNQQLQLMNTLSATATKMPPPDQASN